MVHWHYSYSLITAFLAPPADRNHDLDEVITVLPPLVRILAFGFLGQAIYLLLTPEIFYQKKTWMISLVSFSGVAVNVLGALLLVKAAGRCRRSYGRWSLVMFFTGLLAGFFSMLIKAPSQHWASLIRITLVGGVAGLFLLLPRPNSAYLEALLGMGILASFVLTLWIMSDPSLRDLITTCRRLVAHGLARSPKLAADAGLKLCT